MRWLNCERLGSPEEPITFDECIDRMTAEENDTMDLRYGANMPIHTLLTKRDELLQEAKELRPSELDVLRNKIGRNRMLSKAEKQMALDFLEDHSELWDEEDDLTEEENTPNPAWDKIRWNATAYRVYLDGLNNKPITLWALNREGRNKAAKFYKLNSQKRTLLWLMGWAYWGAIEDGNEPDETWLVQPFEVEKSAWLWGFMPFRKAIHVEHLKKMAMAIKKIGSRFQLKTMLDQYNERLKRTKLNAVQKDYIGKDIKALWDMWKYAKWMEQHTYTPDMDGRW